MRSASAGTEKGRTARTQPAAAAGQRVSERNTPESPATRAAIVAGAAVTLASFALYFATAARDIVFGDTPELTTAALKLGVAHPPGYPLFTLIGWLFGRLPVGPAPFRIALLSVTCHALTVGLVYAMTYRFTGSAPAALVSASALATEPLFWEWSLVGEVFPLNDLLSAAMLFLAALWHERRRDWMLIAAGLVGGLGMAHHQTIALLGPAVLYLMWRGRRTLMANPSLILKAGVAFGAAAAIPYFELLVAAARHPAWMSGELSSVRDLPAYVFRTRYGSGSLINAPQFAGGSPWPRILALFASLDPLQWILLAVGTAYAWRVRRWYAAYVLVAFAFAGPAFAAYANANLDSGALIRAVFERFFLLPHTVLAPMAGFAVLAVGRLGERFRIRRQKAEMLFALLSVLVAIAFVPRSYRDIDQSGNHMARWLGQDLLATMKPSAVLFSIGDAVILPVLYLQAVEGVRPDVVHIVMPATTESWYWREVKRAHPDLAIPSEESLQGGKPIRAFVDANRQRPIAVVDDTPDGSLAPAYNFYGRGIMFDLVPKGGPALSLNQFVAANEAILSQYHNPGPDDFKGPYRVWERLARGTYSTPYYRVGEELRIAADGQRTVNPTLSAQLYASAKDWYRRALAVDPDSPAKERMAHLP